MALTNAQKIKAFRDKNLALGREEMRSIYATKAEQAILKKLCRDKLKELRA